MIDDMVALLKKEQADDIRFQKEYAEKLAKQEQARLDALEKMKKRQSAQVRPKLKNPKLKNPKLNPNAHMRRPRVWLWRPPLLFLLACERASARPRARLPGGDVRDDGRVQAMDGREHHREEL